MVRFIRLGRITGREASEDKRHVIHLFIWVAITFALVMLSSTVKAQSFQTTMFGNLGLGYQMNGKNVYEPGFSGAGLRLDRIQVLDSSNFSIVSGFEFSFLGWGSQVLVNNGFRVKFLQHKKFGVFGTFSALNGIALLRPKLLYAGAFDLGFEFNYELKKNLSIYLSSGFRYSICPGYQDYGSIWSYSDIPIGIGLQWSFN
jgi:hypothetical protein